jgi:general L-amino acid transport system permease protein
MARQDKQDKNSSALGLLGGEGDFGNPIAPDTPQLLTRGLRDLITKNLFKGPKNSLLTIVFGSALLWIAVRAFTFMFLNTKTFTGDDGGTITRSGWEVVRNELKNYMIGPRFAESETSLLFVWIGVWLLLFAAGAAAGTVYDPEAKAMPLGRRLGMFGAPTAGIVLVLSMTRTITPTLAVLVAVAAALVGRRAMIAAPAELRGRLGIALGVLVVVAFGFLTGFTPNNVSSFGGLLLTFTVSSVSIVACFPIGVVMALARRSSFPLIRPIAVGYIEFIRGVPLISLLFIGQFALGFLLSPGTDPPEPIFRAIIMITLFSAAYVAEIVRGGLQSVPDGQTEAGQAVGLQPLTITARIILPQALRNSIPPLIGQFISLLKDTTLLFIIGQRELLNVTAAILGGEEYRFQGFTQEAYAFVALIFWLICFTMSRSAQRLETRLGVGNR